MPQVFNGEQAQLLQLAALSLIDKPSRHKRFAAEGTTIVTLQRECAVRNEMAARKSSPPETSLFAVDVGNPRDEVVGKSLASRHIPPFHEWRPVQLDAHHVVDAFRDFGEPVGRNGVQGMKQFLADAIAVFLQAGNKGHHRRRRLRLHVDILAADAEEHGLVAQSHLRQLHVVHIAYSLKGN